MSSSAHWTSSISRANGWSVASDEIATPARSNARSCLASGDSDFEPWLVAPGDGVADPSDRGRRGGAPDKTLDGARCEQASRQQERPPDLLVGRDRDACEPAAGGKLGGGQQQPRLADPRLTLQGDGGQVGRRLAQLLRDRLELGAAPDDRTPRPAQLDRERALRADEGVQRPTVAQGEGHLIRSGRELAGHGRIMDPSGVVHAPTPAGPGARSRPFV